MCAALVFLFLAACAAPAPKPTEEIAAEEGVYAPFAYCGALTAVVVPGSYAETYCREYGIAFR